MASWQYDFHLIPIGDGRGSDVLKLRPDDLGLFDFSELWVGKHLPDGHEEFLNSCVMKCDSWHRDIESWGDRLGNIIEITVDNKNAVDISVRVDASAIDLRFLDCIVRFSELCKCKLFTQDHELIEPTVDNILSAIKGPKLRLQDNLIGS